jgi:hypothetical protein
MEDVGHEDALLEAGQGLVEGELRAAMDEAALTFKYRKQTCTNWAVTELDAALVPHPFLPLTAPHSLLTLIG